MLSNAYFLAKFRFETAENEPAKNLQNPPPIARRAAGTVQRSAIGQRLLPGAFHGGARTRALNVVSWAANTVYV